jgi:hypothetical protein
MQSAGMKKHIHIRDFDAVLHEKLVQRAQSKHLSLSQYLRNELPQFASRPSLDEVLDRLKTRKTRQQGQMRKERLEFAFDDFNSIPIE